MCDNCATASSDGEPAVLAAFGLNVLKMTSMLQVGSLCHPRLSDEVIGDRRLGDWEGDSVGFSAHNTHSIREPWS